MLLFLRSILGTRDTPTDAAPTPSKPSCWRIQNIPQEWSQEELLRRLKEIDKSLENLEAHWLSVYPAYSGNTKTGLLNMKVPLQFFSNLDPDSTHPITIIEQSETKEKIEIDISLDCHFNGLTPLNIPKGEDIIDVVAVTGLNGHAFESWRNRVTHRMWLKDFLPKDIPQNIRILTYGYDSSLIKPGKRGLLEYRRTLTQCLSNARSTLAEKSRPLIFIGHNLGCIVITQALLQSRDNPDHSHILDATSAVFFFGAPHAGLKVDAFVTMVEDLTPDKKSTRLQLLKQLEEDSEFLEAQKESLIEVWTKMKIFSFYELNDTPTIVKGASGKWEMEGEAVQMIRNISSMLYLPQEHRFAIDEDNTNMVKFMMPTDKDYRTLVLHLKESLDMYPRLRLLQHRENLVIHEIVYEPDLRIEYGAKNVNSQTGQQRVG